MKKRIPTANEEEATMSTPPSFEIIIRPTEDAQAYEATLFEVDEDGRSGDALWTETAPSALSAVAEIVDAYTGRGTVTPVESFVRNAEEY